MNVYAYAFVFTGYGVTSGQFNGTFSNWEKASQSLRLQAQISFIHFSLGRVALHIPAGYAEREYLAREAPREKYRSARKCASASECAPGRSFPKREPGEAGLV